MKMAAESSDFKEVKKLLKPLVEKRRRDRMNRSLDQLKSFLLKHTRSESFRKCKMEKADILEMTVQFLRSATLPDPQERHAAIPRHNYQAGFQECLQQVNSFVRSCPSINAQAKSGLMERLTGYVDNPAGHCTTAPGESAPAPAPAPCDPWPGHSGTSRPLAVVTAVSSHAPARYSPGSGHSPSTPAPGSGHSPIPCHHFAVSPQKASGCFSPAWQQQITGKETISRTVWRPWP